MTKTNLPQISVQADKAIDKLYNKKCWEIIETAIEDTKRAFIWDIDMTRFGERSEYGWCSGCFAGHCILNKGNYIFEYTKMTLNCSETRPNAKPENVGVQA